MRLIDAGGLKADLRQYFTDGVLDGISARLAFNQILHDIDNAPTVEPQKIVIIPPELIEKLASCVVDIVGNIDWEKAIEAYKARPQGEWISHIRSIECSVCKHEFFADDENENCQDYEPCTDFDFNFCPKCGADMRGDRG